MNAPKTNRQIVKRLFYRWRNGPWVTHLFWHAKGERFGYAQFAI